MNSGKFCSRACRNKAYPNKGRVGVKLYRERNPSWKGGSYIEPEKGYRMIRMPEHPRARTNGYVLEHILVAEKMLGRALKKGEVIHHLNHNRSDNRPENLKVYASHKEHWMEHHYHDVQNARDQYFQEDLAVR